MVVAHTSFMISVRKSVVKPSWLSRKHTVANMNWWFTATKHTLRHLQLPRTAHYNFKGELYWEVFNNESDEESTAPPFSNLKRKVLIISSSEIRLIECSATPLSRSRTKVEVCQTDHYEDSCEFEGIRASASPGVMSKSRTDQLLLRCCALLGGLPVIARWLAT